jgi:hypothetical protein
MKKIVAPKILTRHNPFPVSVEHYQHLGDTNEIRDPWYEWNMRWCKRIRAVLDWHYPGHPWGVAVSRRQGMAQILMPSFTDWSFNIRLNELYSDPGLTIVVRGAGELLERYRIPRCNYSSSHYLEAMARTKPWLNRMKPPPE